MDCHKRVSKISNKLENQVLVGSPCWEMLFLIQPRSRPTWLLEEHLCQPSIPMSPKTFTFFSYSISRQKCCAWWMYKVSTPLSWQDALDSRGWNNLTTAASVTCLLRRWHDENPTEGAWGCLNLPGYCLITSSLLLPGILLQKLKT